MSVSDKQVEKSISTALTGQQHVILRDLIENVGFQLYCPQVDVTRVLNLMRDRDEISSFNGDSSLVRLTAIGNTAHGSIRNKLIHYISSNWIAILSLILSLIALSIKK